MWVRVVNADKLGQSIHLQIKMFQRGEGLMAFPSVLMTSNMCTCPSKMRGTNVMRQCVEKVKVGLLRVRKEVRVKDVQSLLIIVSHINTARQDFILIDEALDHANNVIEA